MKNWIMAIRPKTLFASISPVILGLSIAYFEQNHINLTVSILTLLCALSLQIASNLANDYLDSQKGVDNENRLGPTRVTQKGLISSKIMKRALFTSLLISFILGLYLMWYGGIVIIVMGFLSLYFAYGYTGGPYPLSYNGLGEVAAFVFFGVIAVSGTTYLQTHNVSFFTLILSFGPGFISATILAVNNLRDIETDRETHKKTLAVRFGEGFQRKLCLLFIILSTFVPLIISLSFHIYWLLPLFFLPIIFTKNWLHIAKANIDKKMNDALAKTAQYLLLYCLLISLVLFFS